MMTQRGLTDRERVLVEGWDTMIRPFLGQLTAMMVFSFLISAAFPQAAVAADDEVDWETGDTSTLQKKGNTMVGVLKVLAVLVLVEVTDIVFAVDSIPAIFAVTSEPFLVFTANAFAILGLRAMYFMLAGMADRFSLLKYGLALVLVFIGTKMLLIDVYPIPVPFSLGVVAVIIATSIVLSLRRDARQRATEPVRQN